MIIISILYFYFLYDIQSYLFYSNRIRGLRNFQCRINANMPLRCLFYASDTYSVLVKDKNIYGTKMLPLPSPTFVVFYNGRQKMDEEGELRLSDAFVKKQENPNLEVIVKVKNINMGNSRELFEKCRPMRDYMIFVDKVRRYSQEQTLEDAVEQTIRECMEEDVMADFLKRNRAEVVKMCLYEYDEEKQREFDREEGREEGREEERQNTLREKARADEEKLRADEAFRKIAILEKQLAELMK